MQVKDAKLSGFVTGKESESIVVLAKKMQIKKLRNIYIINNKKEPIGVISLVDFNNKIIAKGKSPTDLTAKSIMNSPVWTINQEADIKEAYYDMLKKGRYVLPVTKEGKLSGILSMSEALKLIIKTKTEKNE